VTDEVIELKRRLAEAEDTLRAIRDGEVDALLVRGSDHDQVFHLVGAESYRAFMEVMELGAAALDEAQRILYANAALSELLGRPTDDLQRTGLWDALGDMAAPVRRLLDDVEAGPQRIQIDLPLPNGERSVLVTAAALFLNFSNGYALTFTDITERVEAAVSGETERVGRAIMASANDAVVICDADGLITHASPAVADILTASPVGRRFEEAFRLSFAPAAGVIQADDLVTVALGGSSIRNIEAVLLGDRPKDLMVSVAPLRQSSGAVRGCIISLTDMSERKALEKRQALLMRELDHRMKNMLAMVLSISARTAAGAADLKDFSQRFTQRISALAATQNLLAGRAWEGLALADLVGAELAPHVPANSPRIRTRGLEVDINRDAAVALGLVLHELVTNAVKYGSLSNDNGAVEITATPIPGGGLEIIWQEMGGPPVSAPDRRGFGQTVIARGLGNSASKDAEVSFDPAGVHCRMILKPEALD
jgi:two-component sensor histidine kinase